ncbi:glycoside hydrolase family 38 N-terminal domain-containing protein [Agromyces ramosus]|uniref:Alpha-mannosidase n=1 Tax=Agromyces ramosus TaxID=33879 RepID=A0ABU0R7F9_9MICO|nr:hypothetical protein [Agromyces ramosus]MDQ0893993.1 alpha-mannosidase [Agromyces ramosus]
MDSTPSLTIDEILVLQHSHLDVGYTHSQPIVWELQKEFITQALDWLERTGDLPDDSRPKWTCEATEPVYRWLKEATPADARRFRRLFAAGRIGIGALRWHAGGLADRAGLRRLLDGKDELEQFLGGPVQVACQHDVNGVSWPMSDLLLEAGVDLLVMGVNPYLGRPLDSRPGMFLWETPSGQQLRVFNGHHYTMFDQNFYSWEDSVDRMAEGWAELSSHLTRRGYGLDFVYLTSTASPVMWDNAPPNPYLPNLIQRWNEAGVGPRIRYATFDDLRERALAVPSGKLPVVRGDWTEYWSHGYASTPIATAVNQRAKPMLAAAERLTAGAEHPVLQRARDSIDLYDEHTWGHWDTSPSHPQAQTGEILKAAMAHEGHEFASFALMDGLERLAGNPVADRGVKGVLLANPGPDTVTIRPQLPAAWFPEPGEPLERTYRPSRMFFNRRPWGHEYPGHDAKCFGPIRLEPYSWRSISLDDLPPADDGGRTVTHEVLSRAGTRWEANGVASTGDLRRTGRIESPWHVLEYDPATGRILSLIDRFQQRELLDLASGFDLFSFVRERPDSLVDGTRFAYYDRDMMREKFDESCWKPWAVIRERATRVTACAVTESAEGITFERRLDAPGLLSLVQRFTFHADEPVIGVQIEMELAPEESPQGFYFALPLAMKAGWRAAFDTAGQLVELDADQIPGACRNWATTESLAAMWDDDGMVALLTPDAPMVQFGDFHFGPPLDSIPRPENPLMLAWPVNNYWDTNYAKLQPGRISLAYGLVTAPTADLEAVQRQARALRQPPLVWPITTGGRPDGSGALPAPAADVPA